MGFPEKSKGYRCYCPSQVLKLLNQLTHSSLRLVIALEVLKSKDIVFEEECMTVSLPIALEMIEHMPADRNILNLNLQ